MRTIALVNQKGGVGKTTTTVNVGAALARMGRRVVLIDLDPQANLSMHLGLEVGSQEPTTYGVLNGACTVEQALRATSTEGLRVLPANIDLSGAELELAAALGREQVLQDALRTWTDALDGDPADYVLIDCPPSLGLLSVNGLVAADQALVTLQTSFLALQGTSRLVDVVELLRRRLNPELRIVGILPCMYDSRTRLAREVLAEIRTYFPDLVFRTPIQTNVKLAEAPSFGRTIFDYAPESRGARDYLAVARELLEREGDAEETEHAEPAREVPRPTALPPAETDAAPQTEPTAEPLTEPSSAGPTALPGDAAAARSTGS